VHVIGVDDAPRLPKILVQERMAETATGICQQGIDWTTLRSCTEFIYAFGCRKIGLESFDLGTASSKSGRRLYKICHHNIRGSEI
jgi:hypothetical protein